MSISIKSRRILQVLAVIEVTLLVVTAVLYRTLWHNHDFSGFAVIYAAFAAALVAVVMLSIFIYSTSTNWKVRTLRFAILAACLGAILSYIFGGY